MTTHIRKAEAHIKEVHKLLWVLKEHYAQLAASSNVLLRGYAVWRPAYLERMLKWAIEDPQWLVLTNNKLDGLMIASSFESPFGLGRFAQEHLIRVGSSKLADYLGVYEIWAHNWGCERVSVGCIERTEAFERVLRPLGYTRCETTFSKVLIGAVDDSDADVNGGAT